MEKANEHIKRLTDIKFYKKLLFACISLCLLAGCTAKNKDKLPEVKPENFNFVFCYGIGAKNILDTTEGMFTKDMLTAPPITIDFNLRDKEMKSIYDDMKNIDILNYPAEFNPKGIKNQNSFETYMIKISWNSNVKYITWKDEALSDDNEAIKLRSLFSKIKNMIINKEEYKELPDPAGVYS